MDDKPKKRSQINCNSMNADKVRVYEDTAMEWGISLSALGSVVLEKNADNLNSYRQIAMEEQQKRYKRGGRLSYENDPLIAIAMLKRELDELKRRLGE